MLYSLYISLRTIDRISTHLDRSTELYPHVYEILALLSPSKSLCTMFFASVPLKIGFALVVAFLLTQTRLAGFYRSVYYLPSLIGGRQYP